MQFTLKALFDDQTKKEIREAVLGEARAMARAEIQQALDGEVQRVVKQQIAEMSSTMPNYRLRKVIHEIVMEVLRNTWGDIGKDVAAVVDDKMNNQLYNIAEAAVDKAAKKNIAEKMKAMTVWKADSQIDDLKKIVRRELKAILGQD